MSFSSILSRLFVLIDPFEGPFYDLLSWIASESKSSTVSSTISSGSAGENPKADLSKLTS